MMSSNCETCPSPVFSIFTGDQKTISLKIVQGSSFGNPVDLTSCTEIDIALPNADGSFTNLLLSLSQVVITTPAVLGQFTALITGVNSVKLNIGELQNIDVTFTISGGVFTVRFYQALSVFQLD